MEGATFKRPQNLPVKEAMEEAPANSPLGKLWTYLKRKEPRIEIFHADDADEFATEFLGRPRGVSFGDL
jgi:hypothetical protein